MRAHSTKRLLYASRALVTFLATLWLCAGFLMPPKEIQIYPSAKAQINGFDDSQTDGNSYVEWKARSQTQAVFTCHFLSGAQHQLCGAAIQPASVPSGDTPQRSAGQIIEPVYNLSEFTHLKINVSVTGEDITFIDLMLRDRTVNRKPRAQETTKVMHTTLHHEEFGRAVSIPLSEFKVADWWLRKNRVHRKKSMPSFDKIIELSLGVPSSVPNGHYDFAIYEISAYGPWITREQAYLSVILTGLFGLIVELGTWIYSMRTRIVSVEESLEEANQQANIDPLTGLNNRRAICQAIDSLLLKRQEITITLFDIDHFKNINDTYGHNVGDEVLQHIAHTINSSIRSGDIFGRWGGEEFILISCGLSPKQGLDAAARLNKSIADAYFHSKDVASLKITMSGGITQHNYNEYFTQTLERADKGLYIAKNNGRNQVIDM